MFNPELDVILNGDLESVVDSIHTLRNNADYPLVVTINKRTNEKKLKLKELKEKKRYKLYYHYYVNHCNNVSEIVTHLTWDKWSKGNIYNKDKCIFLRTLTKEIVSEDKN